MKKRFLLLVLAGLFIAPALSQTASTDPHWTLNTKFSDEFDGIRNAIWQNMEGDAPWGSSFFTSDNIGYGIENGRHFIRFVGEMVNGTPYTGGIRVGGAPGYGGHLGLGYGYYEVEARVLQEPNIVSGLWPAFWLQQGGNEPSCWYEELDIFEPDNCQVRENNHHVTYHRNPSGDCPNTVNVTILPDCIDHYGVDMSQWHKYAVEWLEGRVTFYLDDKPFWEISNRLTPFHQNTNVMIDLQTDRFTRCPPDTTIDRLLGYYDVNYFRYYQLKCSNTVVNEISNFNKYCYAVKKSITLSSATTIPAGSNISLRASDFIELHSGFEVPLGAELYLDINPCEGPYITCPNGPGRDEEGEE